MNQLKKHLSILLFSLFLAATSAMAEGEPSLYGAGMRAGTSIMGEDIEQADFFIARQLPWTKSFDCGWNLQASAELSLNILHNEAENGASISVSTDVDLASPQHRYFFLSGVGTGVLEDSAIGDHYFGGPIFFLFHAGTGFHITDNLSLAWRYAHQSNGHIYINNPSLNLNQIELRYRF